VDFDPGPNVDTKSASDLGAIFATKFNALGGYAGTAVAQGPLSVAAITTSGDSVHIGGYFIGTADFDPYGSVQQRTSGGTGYVLRLASTGAFGSVYTFEQGPTPPYLCRAIDSGVLAATLLQGSTSFSLSHLVGDTVVWSFPLPNGVQPSALGASNGGFEIVGIFRGMVDFDPGTPVDSVSGGAAGDAFLSRYGF
jgi:hypothetical protein